MPEFSDTRQQLQQVRSQKAQQATALHRNRERLKQVQQRKQILQRQVSQSDARYQALLQEEQGLRDQIGQAQATLQDSLQWESDLLIDFATFSDPRTELGQLSDEYPFLLMPVRLETRFKRVRTADGTQHQLWVRIFPDDCSVDSFESTLSEAEVQNARDYWLRRWQAGRVADPNAPGAADLQAHIRHLHLGAWRSMAGPRTPGRAYWLTQQYAPINPTLPPDANRFREEDLPVRQAVEDLILVIPVLGELPPAAQVAALQSYWLAYAQAQGDAAALENALNAFTSSLGGDTTLADQLLAQHRPFNLAALDDLPTLPSRILVTFVVFPAEAETDTQQQSWARTARIDTFPDRFVLMGFQGFDAAGRPAQVLGELGHLIPSPLTVGPDPSEDILSLLQAWYAEAYLDLSPAEQVAYLNDLYDQLTPQARAARSQADFRAEWQGLDEAALADKMATVVAKEMRDEIKAERYVAHLASRSETSWLFDFDRAVQVGMGFKVTLTEAQYNAGFDRLFVLGVRMGSDPSDAQEALQTLLAHHQYGNSGLSFLPQGTPTNNTETEDSGYSETDDLAEAFARYFPEEAPEADDSSDGARFARLLGLDAEAAGLSTLPHYGQRDLAEAQAMQQALWPATMGYFLDSMMHPLISDRTEAFAQDFFTRYVSGRGPLPALRIDDQPYGIVPTTVFSRLAWFDREHTSPVVRSLFNQGSQLRQLYQFLGQIRRGWSLLLDQVAYVGKEGDPHDILLQALGLHASSVSYEQRIAYTRELMYNYLALVSLTQPANLINGKAFATMKAFQEAPSILTEEGDALLQAFLEKGVETPPEILDKLFFAKANDLSGPVIDDRPLSEHAPIRAYTADDQNYITQLIRNARTSLNALKRNEGFDGPAPKALLYQLLRHALQLGYLHVGRQLEPNAASQVKVDRTFIGIQEIDDVSLESKYAFLEQRSVTLEGQTATLATHIPNLLQLSAQPLAVLRLSEELQAMQTLAELPTARLERLLAEHLDCCSYRLDAWLTGFVHAQLEATREGDARTGTQASAQQGLYLGAYGWVEDLRPDDRSLSTVNDLSPQLDRIFDPANPDHPLLRDDSNLGFVHAPSLSHALTAAVLRNAYHTRASSAQPDLFKVNLSSERVRMGMRIIQGMQQGQSLGALLGYQLERGLHDRHDEAEVDRYIYELRKAFPLRANRHQETALAEGDLDSITQLEARNVVDGLKLIRHIQRSGNDSYPFGKNLLSANSAQQAVIDEEVERLRNLNDAVADLALAEGVHQAVQSNYDRAAGALDAYSKGGYPQNPEVAATPRSGVTLTHRCGLHLPIVPSPLDPEVPPRVMAEPSVNALLSNLLPDLGLIVFTMTQRVPSYDGTPPTETTDTPSLADLDLTPIDLLYLINPETDQQLTALDDHALRWAHANPMPGYRPDATFVIGYTEPLPGQITLFEVIPLLRALRRLILSARPLRATDLQLGHEASEGTQPSPYVDEARLLNSRDRLADHLNGTRTALALVGAQAGFLALAPEAFPDQAAYQAAVLADLDDFISDFESTLSDLNFFHLPQAGFGYVYDRRATIFQGVYQAVADYRARWQGQLSDCNDLLADVPGAGTDEAQFDLLRRAEQLVSTDYTTVAASTTVSSYTTVVTNKRDAFAAKLADMDAFLTANHGSFQALLTDLADLRGGAQPLSNFDQLPLETQAVERHITVLAEEMIQQVTSLDAQVVAMYQQVVDLLSQQASEGDPAKKLQLLQQAAQVLFGEAFKLVPHFLLGEAQRAEIQQALGDQSQLLAHLQNTQHDPFPVDSWLYGVARVREAMQALEQATLYVEGFDPSQDLSLRPLQFPYQPDDSWLAGPFPESYPLEGDKLLYTAYWPIAKPNEAQCGLLLDEWTEVLPTRTENTGLTFHYDQPNHEAPQAMLLVTTPRYQADPAWDWQNLVDSLHETLDMARLRALEPAQINTTPYAQYLPTTVSAVTRYLVTMSLNLAAVNGQVVPIDNETTSDDA